MKYEIKKVDDTSPHYNLILYKNVKKRDGSIVVDIDTTLYSISLNHIKNGLSHLETSEFFGDTDISLKEYLTQFYKSYNNICESLKKTL